MLAFDCTHEMHEVAHFTAETTGDLLERVRQHRDQYHPEIDDAELRKLVQAGTYVPELVRPDDEDGEQELRPSSSVER
jgi:hypothetical protein